MNDRQLAPDGKCRTCPMRGVRVVCAGQHEHERCGSAADLDGPSRAFSEAFATAAIPAAPRPLPEVRGGVAMVPPGYCRPCRDAKPRGSLADTIGR